MNKLLNRGWTVTLIVVAACVVWGGAQASTVVATYGPSDIKGPWPLTVKSVKLHCLDDGRFVVFETPDGRVVAVNGKARSNAGKKSYIDLDAIWATDSKGSRLSTMSDLSKMAIDTCKGR